MYKIIIHIKIFNLLHKYHIGEITLQYNYGVLHINPLLMQFHLYFSLDTDAPFHRTLMVLKGIYLVQKKYGMFCWDFERWFHFHGVDAMKSVFLNCCVLHEEFLPFCNVWYTCLIKYHSNVRIFGNISALCFFGLVISFVSAVEYQTNNDNNYDKADGSYHPCK